MMCPTRRWMPPSVRPWTAVLLIRQASPGPGCSDRAYPPTSHRRPTHHVDAAGMQLWHAATVREAGSSGLPRTWVASDQSGALGAVGLGRFDIEQHRAHSPWLLSTQPATRSV